jgi:outer membrane lipoprotein LolB
MNLARSARALAGTCALAWLAGCAQLPRTPVPELVDAPVRTGRLALSVQDQPEQSMSATFELRGRSQAGQLTLLNPLGSTLAVLRWQPGSATLATPGRDPQQFPSLEAMVQQATGAPLPVAALFDWLAGTPTAVPGWEPDLTQVADGRLRAIRREPPPQADLRVVLDR